MDFCTKLETFPQGFPEMLRSREWDRQTYRQIHRQPENILLSDTVVAGTEKEICEAFIFVIGVVSKPVRLGLSDER